MNTVYQQQSLPGIPYSKMKISLEESVKFQLKKRVKQLIDFAKYSYLAMVMILLLIAVVELKHIFQIDIFPGIDTPIDNAYYAGKDQLGGNIL